jgi:pantoate--beta-alanine ligase
MYPRGFATTVSLGGPAEGLEGACRPGFFDGVATVVTKLFTQALPDIAVFGEKDFQQLHVVRRLVNDLDLKTRIVGVATVREDDGLALSSRNAYLSDAQRKIAPRLFEVLTRAAEAFPRHAAPAALLAETEADLASTFDRVDYVAWRDTETFDAEIAPGRPGRLLAAVQLGATRLIDNVPVAPAETE